MSTLADRIAYRIDEARAELRVEGLADTSAMERAVRKQVEAIAALIIPTSDQRMKLEEVRFDLATLTLLVHGFSMRTDSPALRECLKDLSHSLDSLEESLIDVIPTATNDSGGLAL